MDNSISGAAVCKPTAIGSGQPATALAAIVPTDRTRTSCRSHPTGTPIHANTRSNTTTATSPPSIPAGTMPGKGTPRRAANAEIVTYEPPSP